MYKDIVFDSSQKNEVEKLIQRLKNCVSTSMFHVQFYFIQTWMALPVKSVQFIVMVYLIICL